MSGVKNCRVAWLFPSMYQGNYWHPIFREFVSNYKQTIVYTGFWPGFAEGCEDAFAVEVVGKTTFLETGENASTRHNYGFINASLNIVGRLLAFRPTVIFTSAFSIWTALAVLFKPMGRWRVAILYDGSSPTVDHQGDWFRMFARRAIAKLVDAFIANSAAAKEYLTEGLRIPVDRVFYRTYLVPDEALLLKSVQPLPLHDLKLRRPVFLFVGQIVPRKGLNFLLDACSILKKQGCENFTLLAIGDGEQQKALAERVRSWDLVDQVVWTGRVEYGQLGAYFKAADVFVMPTLEDVWGMVILEAMVFGKPILCSKWAGAAEVVVDGENGYVFEPRDPAALAALMNQFIEQPELCDRMGQRSKELVARHNPDTASRSFIDIVEAILRA